MWTRTTNAEFLTTYSDMKHSLSINLILPACLLALVLLPVSCSKDNTGYGDEVTIEGDYREPLSIASDVKIPFPAYVASGLPEEFTVAIKGRLKEASSSVDNALVIVTDMAGYSALDVRKDRVVIVCKPSSSVLEQLGVEAGDYLCVAFQQGRAGQCVVNSPSEGMDVDECLNGLVSWVNSTLQNSTGNFDESSFWEESSLYTTYSDHVREKITNVVASKHDYLEGTFYVDVQLKVTPMHGFKRSDSAALDYYLMTSTVSVASGKMYSGNFTKKHGGVKARICGFYLKSLSSDFTLVDSSGNPVGHFVQTPTPETVVGSTSYTTGWDFSIGGGITGGTSPMITLPIGVSISSSTSRTISDCDVLNRHEGVTVGYDYVINNLPRYKSLHITDPPLVSTSTISFYSQWVWAVPVEDYDSSTKYKVRIDLSNLVYGASYFYSSEKDYHDLEFLQKKYSETKDLPLPNRCPTGKLELTNSEDGTFVTNVKLSNKSHSGTEYLDKSVYAQGSTCSMILVAGDYELQCDIKGKDGKTGTHKYSGPVKVTTGGTVKLSTGYGFK